VICEPKLLLADVACIRLIAGVTVYLERELLGTIKLFLVHVAREASFSGYDTGYQLIFILQHSFIGVPKLVKLELQVCLDTEYLPCHFVCFLAHPLDSEHEVVD